MANGAARGDVHAHELGDRLGRRAFESRSAARFARVVPGIEDGAAQGQVFENGYAGAAFTSWKVGS